jgi:hypothetical protein
MKVGFIGLGTMGLGMAHNLVQAGRDVVVHGIDRELARPFGEAGAHWANSVTELGGSVDVVLTSLPGPVEVEAVGLGEDGLLSTMRPGTTWFDLTTNSPRVVRRVHAVLTDKGIHLLDAPVSGGPAGAQSGRLAIDVGCDKAAFDEYGPILNAIGDQVMYVGEIGAGSIAKLMHNCASLSSGAPPQRCCRWVFAPGSSRPRSGTPCARARPDGPARSTRSPGDSCSTPTIRRPSPSHSRPRTCAWRSSSPTSSTFRWTVPSGTRRLRPGAGPRLGKSGLPVTSAPL